jgi:hypothetical protein
LAQYLGEGGVALHPTPNTQHRTPIHAGGITLARIGEARNWLFRKDANDTVCFILREKET